MYWCILQNHLMIIFMIYLYFHIYYSVNINKTFVFSKQIFILDGKVFCYFVEGMDIINCWQCHWKYEFNLNLFLGNGVWPSCENLCTSIGHFFIHLFIIPIKNCIFTYLDFFFLLLFMLLHFHFYVMKIRLIFLTIKYFFFS